MAHSDPRAIAAAFLPLDPLPTVVERASESAWAEFQQLQSAEDNRYITTQVESHLHSDVSPEQRPFADTAPAARQSLLPDAGQSKPQATVTVEAVMLMARRNGRVCPRSGPWQRLYELLPGKRSNGPIWQPSAPVSPEAWDASSAVAKRLVLREHLEWAARRNALAAVQTFLQGLSEDDWHHAGESA